MVSPEGGHDFGFFSADYSTQAVRSLRATRGIIVGCEPDIRCNFYDYRIDVLFACECRFILKR